MRKLDQRGVVSILTVIFFSILIMIVALATIFAQNKELRQSTDADQSVRAYFAAEAGVETGLRKLIDTPGFRGETCSGKSDIELPDLGSDSGLALTCVKVIDNSLQAGNILNQEKSQQINLKSLSSVASIQLQWQNKDGDSSSYTSDADYTVDPTKLPGPSNPATGTWALPAVMEVTLFSYPVSDIHPSDLQARTILLRPSSSGGRTASFNETSRIQPVNCDSKDQGCLVTINGIPSQVSVVDGRQLRHVVRFRARYNSTKYSVIFSHCPNPAATGCNDNGKIGGEGVRVDVTAKAGSIFRRLVALSQGASAVADMGLDYTIFTRQDVCKDIAYDTSGKLTKNSIYGTGPDCLKDIGPDADEDDPPPFS